MKKAVCLLVIFMMFINTGCAFSPGFLKFKRQNTSENYTMDKVEGFGEELESLAKKNNHEFKKATYSEAIASAFSEFREYNIKIDGNQAIKIEVFNGGYQNGKEKCTFDLTYSVTDKKYLDLDSFVNYVNIPSGINISKKECVQFINSIDLLFDNINTTTDDKGIHKHKWYDFYETWVLDYHEYNGGTVELYFSGLTK